MSIFQDDYKLQRTDVVDNISINSFSTLNGSSNANYSSYDNFIMDDYLKAIKRHNKSNVKNGKKANSQSLCNIFTLLLPAEPLRVKEFSKAVLSNLNSIIDSIEFKALFYNSNLKEPEPLKIFTKKALKQKESKEARLEKRYEESMNTKLENIFDDLILKLPKSTPAKDKDSEASLFDKVTYENSTEWMKDVLKDSKASFTNKTFVEEFMKAKENLKNEHKNSLKKIKSDYVKSIEKHKIELEIYELNSNYSKSEIRKIKKLQKRYKQLNQLFDPLLIRKVYFNSNEPISNQKTKDNKQSFKRDSTLYRKLQILKKSINTITFKAIVSQFNFKFEINKTNTYSKILNPHYHLLHSLSGVTKNDKTTKDIYILQDVLRVTTHIVNTIFPYMYLDKENKLTVRRKPLNSFDLELFSFYSRGNLAEFRTPLKANIYRWVEDSTNGDYIANGKEGKKDGLVFSYDDSTFLDFFSSSSEEFKREIEKIKLDSFIKAKYEAEAMFNKDDRLIHDHNYQNRIDKVTDNLFKGIFREAIKPFIDKLIKSMIMNNYKPTIVINGYRITQISKKVYKNDEAMDTICFSVREVNDRITKQSKAIIKGYSTATSTLPKKTIKKIENKFLSIQKIMIEAFKNKNMDIRLLELKEAKRKLSVTIKTQIKKLKLSRDKGKLTTSLVIALYMQKVNSWIYSSVKYLEDKKVDYISSNIVTPLQVSATIKANFRNRDYVNKIKDDKRAEELDNRDRFFDELYCS